MNYTVYLNNRDAKSLWVDIGLGICGLILLFLFEKIVIGLISLLIALLGALTKQKQKVIISNEGVSVRKLFTKKYTWNLFSEVILKDGMLTLDFKNNILFQHNTDSIGASIDEAAFNAYCKQQIELNNKTKVEAQTIQ